MKTTITLTLEGQEPATLEAESFLLMVKDADGALTTASMIGHVEAKGWAKADLIRELLVTLLDDPIVELRLLGEQLAGVYQGWRSGVQLAARERKQASGTKT